MNPFRFAQGLLLSALLAAPVAASAFPLFETGDRESDPDVAFVPAAAPGASGTYLLTWEREVGWGEQDIFAALLDESGNQIGSDIHLASDLSWEAGPVVASNGYDEFLVVYEREDSVSDQNIYGQRVSSGGVLQGSAFKISTDSRFECRPSVAYDTTHGVYVVVWEHDYSVSDRDIRGRVVSGARVPGQEFVVAYSEKDDMIPFIAADISSSGFLVIYEHTYSYNDFDLHARSLLLALEGAAVVAVHLLQIDLEALRRDLHAHARTSAYAHARA